MAHPLLAHPDPLGSAGARLQGWAMVAVLAGGFALSVAALLRPPAQQQLHEAMTSEAFLAGRTAGAVNHVMAHGLPGGVWVQEVGAALRWRLFGSGGPQVAVGCGGWLYLTEELRPWPGDEAAMTARADALHRVADALAARGITLLVLMVPDKRLIEAAPACGVPYSAQARGRLAAFRAKMGGLAQADVAAAFAAAPGPMFQHTDTHWNQVGAALAARTVAAAVAQAPITRGRRFATTSGAEMDRPGDLLRLMGLEGVPDLPLALRPLPDRERPDATTETEGPEPGGLLDDAPVADVVLLGSSFSINGNFHGRLQEALGASVGQFGQEGGAFWRSARDYFRSPAFHETPPKLVIWEFPERVIGQPVTADEAAFLAAGVGNP